MNQHNRKSQACVQGKGDQDYLAKIKQYLTNGNNANKNKVYVVYHEKISDTKNQE